MSFYEEQIALLNQILEIQFSENFICKMKARVFVGYHRYGPSKQYAENGPYDILETIEKRLQAYRETGNQEHLVDAANFIMIEFMYPKHAGAHFDAVAEEDDGKRLGLVRTAETLLRVDTENKRGLT